MRSWKVRLSITTLVGLTLLSLTPAPAPPAPSASPAASAAEPWIHDPYTSNWNLASYPSGPSNENLLGTDDRGRDILARLIYGLRYSLFFAGLTLALSFSLGAFLGFIAGFFGGVADLLLSRLVEIVENLPALLLLMLFASLVEPRLWRLALLLACLDWSFSFHQVRVSVQRLKRQDFVLSSVVLGASPFHIFHQHILPHTLTPLSTQAPLAFAKYISSLTFLDFLGLGLPPPTPSWGEMLYQAQRNWHAEWLFWGPTLALATLLLCLFTVSNELMRDFRVR
ncbi:MAG: peptide ABC transporter permease [Bdellovibrio sp.]|nr:MAG: peptide ABC transporter permease [Bdellovibrio sp.]